jgi:hypothetical protein
VPTIPKPLILDNADLLIDGQTLACVVNHLELTPDVSVITLTSMCGEIDYPGVVKWSLVATLYQSFDPAATEEVLSAAVEGGVPVQFAIQARRDDPISATNPAWYGEVIPQPYAPINGDAGAESTIDLEWSVVGAPSKTITTIPPLTVMAGTAEAPAETPA